MSTAVPPKAAFLVIRPDGTATWRPLSDEQAVGAEVGGRHGALGGAAVFDLRQYGGPVRVIAADVGALFPADYPPNPAAVALLFALSDGRLAQPWHGTVAITQYERDDATGEVLWPGVMEAGLAAAIGLAARTAGAVFR